MKHLKINWGFLQPFSAFPRIFSGTILNPSAKGTMQGTTRENSHLSKEVLCSRVQVSKNTTINRVVNGSRGGRGGGGGILWLSFNNRLFNLWLLSNLTQWWQRSIYNVIAVANRVSTHRAVSLSSAKKVSTVPPTALCTRTSVISKLFLEPLFSAISQCDAHKIT